jgi:diacylglycerol kinase (ATP)
MRNREMVSRMKSRFIVNARSGRAAKALPAVRAFAATHGATIVVTERRSHGAELAAQALADGCELVVAVGGDGTMNEVASALVGTSATLGLVPCGSGDGLGRHLRIHGSIERALEILVHGVPRLIDSGTVDGHPFFTAAGLGFEAEIAERFNRFHRRGFMRYLTTSAALWREWTPELCTISHAGGRETVSAFTMAVANANQYGNGAQIAPAARIDDGKLDLTVIPRLTLMNILPLLVRLFSGSLPRAYGIRSFVAPHFTIERARAGVIHTDGETHLAPALLEFRVRPASLRIMVPG